MDNNTKGFTHGGGAYIAADRSHLILQSPLPPHTGAARIGGGTKPTPPSHASVSHTLEAVAGSWGAVSAPAESWVEPQSEQNMCEMTFGAGFL